jgi:hypothetical protein
MISREGGWEAEFERLGAGEVRARLETKVYLGESAGLAAAWLARDGEASQAEQLALARAAASEARLANTRSPKRQQDRDYCGDHRGDLTDHHHRFGRCREFAEVNAARPGTARRW